MPRRSGSCSITSASPASVLREAARVLRAGGRVLIVDMAKHERVEYASRWVTCGSASSRGARRVARRGGIRGRARDTAARRIDGARPAALRARAGAPRCREEAAEINEPETEEFK